MVNKWKKKKKREAVEVRVGDDLCIGCFIQRLTVIKRFGSGNEVKKMTDYSY